MTYGSSSSWGASSRSAGSTSYSSGNWGSSSYSSSKSHGSSYDCGSSSSYSWGSSSYSSKDCYSSSSWSSSQGCDSWGYGGGSSDWGYCGDSSKSSYSKGSSWGGCDYDDGGSSSWGGSSWGGKADCDYGSSWGGSSWGGKDESCDDDRGGKDHDRGGWGGKDESCDDDRGGWGGKDHDRGGKGGWGDDRCDGDDTPPPPADDCDDDDTPPPTDDDDCGCDGGAGEPTCGTVSFVIEGEIDTQITLTELDDGTIQVTVAALDGGTVGDLRGLFFDIADESLLAGMGAAGDDVTGSVFAADAVTKVSKGATVKGAVVNTYGAFDGGIEFGSDGIGKDDIRETTFILSSSSGDLTIDMFSEQDFALRYTSVGEEGGCRGDSLKIGGNAGVLETSCDPMTGAIGDYVWLDLDFDGVQDADEAGIEGLVVTLFKDGVDTGLSMLTGADGSYLFEGLAAGDYQIQVSGLSDTQVFTLQNLGDDLADSDVDAYGLSDVYSLAEGETYLGLDAGVYDSSAVVVLGSLGDRIWLDANGDGLQDDGEAGVAGITVALLLDGVATGMSVTTGADGMYLFSDLEAGNYSIAITGIADGYEITTQNAGDEAADSDVNAAGVSDVYTLAEGEDYFDLDAGIVASAPTVAADADHTCADETKVLDVLANDDAGLTITAINGTAIAVGGSVDLASGASITLNADGTLTYDGVAAWADVLVGMSAADAFTYTATTVQGGSATTSVDMGICGAGANSVDDFIPTLSGLAQFTITDLTMSGTGWFSVDVNSDSNPNLNVTGSTDVWCVDLAGTVETMTLDAHVYIADPNDASLADEVLFYENLDIVNYILNHADEYRAMGYADAYIQYSIWALTDEPTLVWDFEEVNEIVTDATANGEGFEAGSGDLVGLILAPIQEVDDNGAEITNYQNFIYGVAFDTLADCLCA